MTHEQVLEVGLEKLVEKYLAKELDAQEIEEFEEHFFSCLECAEEVVSSETFSANVRAVFREREQHRKAQNN